MLPVQDQQVFKVGQQLLGQIGGIAVPAELRDDLELSRHVPFGFGDVAQHHLEFGFLLGHPPSLARASTADDRLTCRRPAPPC